MEIGSQIKRLRQRRGITQEALAQHFGISAQAVSKWERGTAAPDIALLPQLSAYFGVTIDELFALSDDTRMERIQNMLWDVRFLNPADVESARTFLQEKARLEPDNGEPCALLAQLENHLAREHQDAAQDYAKEALSRDPDGWYALQDLLQAMNGRSADWNYTNHYRLIDYYKEFIRRNPENWHAYLFLLDQLIDDYRLEEARDYCERLAVFRGTYHVPLYRGKIEWYSANKALAFQIWEQMARDFPDEWCVWHNIGDFLFKSGKSDQALECYQKALSVQKPPRYLDPCEAMAQLLEIRGDVGAAIEALRQQLRLLETEWNLTQGECVDEVLRGIERLEKKL